MDGFFLVSGKFWFKEFIDFDCNVQYLADLVFIPPYECVSQPSATVIEIVCLGCCAYVVNGVGSFSVFVGHSEGTS